MNMFLFNNYSHNELFQSSTSREIQTSLLDDKLHNTTVCGKIINFTKHLFYSIYNISNNYYYNLSNNDIYNNDIYNNDIYNNDIYNDNYNEMIQRL
jgi:hypothetical protein